MRHYAISPDTAALNLLRTNIQHLHGSAKAELFAYARAQHGFWRVLLVFLLMAAAGLLQAQPLLLTELPRGPLGTWADMLVEDGPPLSLEEAQARQRAGLFRKIGQPVLTNGIGSRPLWVHLELFNPTTESLPLRLVTGTTWADRLNVFIAHGNRLGASFQSGDEYPNARGLTPGAGFTFVINFSPGRSDLYLRVDMIDPLVLPIELMSEEQARSNERMVHYGYGFIYGFLIALLAYNAMLFAGLRERSYLYYALYLASLVLLNIAYTGHAAGWLWPDQPGLQRYAVLVLMVLYSCCGLLFASRFLALAEHAPRALRVVRLGAFLALISIALCVLLDSQLGAALVAFNFMSLFTLCMVLLGILTIRHGRVAGRYFLVAALFGMLGAASTTFSVWGWLPFNTLTYHGLEYGVIIEATLLALALSYRYKEMTTELSRVTVSRDVLSTEVAERKRVEAELRIAAIALETQEGMMITDAHSVIQRVNHAFTKITGYTAEEAVGQTPGMLSSGRQDAKFYAAMWGDIKRNGSWQGEIWNRRKNGELYPQHLTITAVREDAGEITHYVATLHDISERKQTEEQIYELAFHDALTHLPNRRLLSDRLEQTMAASKRSGLYGALMFLDMDNFKPLNDAYGHTVGDALLVEVALRISGCVREADTVARFGGDEFVVMLGELNADKAESATQTHIIAEKIRASLAQPYVLKIRQEGKTETTIEHHCTASIGVVLFINHDAGAEDILKWADMAMYQAKEAGRNLVRFYDPKA